MMTTKTWYGKSYTIPPIQVLQAKTIFPKSGALAQREVAILAQNHAVKKISAKIWTVKTNLQSLPDA